MTAQPETWPRATAASDRLAHIDGLRGLAILAVVLYHAYARWPGLMPFGTAFAVPPISLGWAGVQLFFLISGFVIFLTLDRCRSLPEFVFNRWSRLFPAMLVATIIIVALDPLLPERPHKIGSMANTIAGLTFIGPGWWSLVKIDLTPIEGAFWSLFVEVQFYAVAGVSYFLFGKRVALVVLALLYVLAQATVWSVLPSGSEAHRLVFALTDRLGAEHYGWFLAGALFHEHRRTRHTWLLGSACVVLGASCCLVASPGHWLARTIALAIVAAVFVTALWLPAIQRLLSRPFWLFLGFVSYPLYLNHENLVVALTIKLHEIAPGLPMVLLPVLPIAMAVGLAWLVASHAEPPLRMALRKIRDVVRGPASWHVVALASKAAPRPAGPKPLSRAHGPG
jgi:peptidoglycan/LPS O-acetylase OafA/YrhL